MVPTVGAEGVTGCARMIKEPEGKDVHPAAFVTVYTYVPGIKLVMV